MTLLDRIDAGEHDAIIVAFLVLVGVVFVVDTWRRYVRGRRP